MGLDLLAAITALAFTGEARGDSIISTVLRRAEPTLVRSIRTCPNREKNVPSISTPLRGCKWRSGCRLLNLHGSVFAAMDALSCIINRRGDSQAGRRRFDPGLPLHSFQSLTEYRPVPSGDFGLRSGA